jgi:epsilon-lactone hydrolase
MSQQQKDAIEEMIRNAPLDIGGEVTEQRANFEAMLAAQPLPGDVVTAPGELGGVPVLNIETGEGRHDATLLWFHGGWYCIGSPRTSAGMSSDLARRADAKVISVDYRLAPEHPYPAALGDARAAYGALLESGTDPARSPSSASPRAVAWRRRCSPRWPATASRSRPAPSCSRPGPTSRSAASR